MRYLVKAVDGECFFPSSRVRAEFYLQDPGDKLYECVLIGCVTLEGILLEGEALLKECKR